MTWGVLNVAMLAGLAGVALPVIVHLLNRRRDTVIEWGAMQFLELGKRARRRIRLAELLLMLARMGLLALAALALARPYLASSAAGAGASANPAAAAASGPRRDIVLVIDGSASMSRRIDGSTPRARATDRARGIVRQARPGDTVAILLAGQRVSRLVDPPSFDAARWDSALDTVRDAPGLEGSDLPSALVDAFRILEKTQNPERLVVLVSDGQRYAWRPGELARWSLVRELHRRLPVPPAIWAIRVGGGGSRPLANAAVGPLEVSRPVITPGLTFEVTTSVQNLGPGPVERTAALFVDGRPAPVAPRTAGSIAEGARVPLSFRTTIAAPGSHVLSVRLDGLDALPQDDESALPVAVAPALPVLLVEGSPGAGPLRGASDFLRIALAPSGDAFPSIRARVISPARLDGASMRGQRVVALAGVERLESRQTAALAAFIEAGGGLVVVPGSALDARAWRDFPGMPARFLDTVGDPSARRVVAHPAPRSFVGPVMTPFGRGDSPPLAEADIFAYRQLDVAAGSSTWARFDHGDPWIVERSWGRGRVILLAASMDADGGTLPVNPDFVPLVHELVYSLVGAGPRTVVSAGEPILFPIEAVPPAEWKSLTVETPGGERARAVVVRDEGQAQARLEDAAAAGVYRLELPDPPGGSVFAAVAGDPRESEPQALDSAEAEHLARGWPLVFEDQDTRLDLRLADHGGGEKREIWRGLVLAALGVLCVEVFLTRRIVRTQGLEQG